MDHSHATAFTIGDVFRDAWASFRRRFVTHLGFDAAIFAALFLTLCIVGCLMIAVVGATGAVVGATGGGANGGSAPAAVVVVAMVGTYAAFLLAIVVVFALHQGVTLALSDADLHGEPVELGTALRRGTGRLASLVGATFLRYLVDWSFGLALVVLVIGALVAAQGQLPRLDDPNAWSSPLWGVGLAASYLAWIAWVLVVRCFTGLSGPAVQFETLGPIDALVRSARLLAGHRLQFFLLRLAWGAILFLLLILAEIPMFAMMFGMRDSNGVPDPAAGLLMFPFLFFVYAVGLLAYSFDSVLDAAYYRRLEPSTSHAAVAEVFT